MISLYFIFYFIFYKLIDKFFFKEILKKHLYFKMPPSVEVGVVFTSSEKLKKAIPHDVISKHYETTIIKSDQLRYIMKRHNNNYK